MPKNPAFDFRVVTLDHIALLQRVASGDITRMQRGMMDLFRRKLVTTRGWYGNKGLAVTTRGQFALRMLFVGQKVRFTDSYRIDYMRGKTGTIENVRDGQTDADGFDEHGYVVKRAKPQTSLTIRVDGESGQWMVYRPQDLEVVFSTGLDSGMAVDGYFPGRDPAADVVSRV